MVHAVAEYARVSLDKALDMPCDLFQLCYKNHTVEALKRTEAGREYLETCERMRQTKLDKKALYRLMERLKR